MAKFSRFKKRNSDRSGFTYLEMELVRDEGSLVGPDEFDTPPPSKRPLGGEGDISPGDTSNTPNSYTDGNFRTTYYLTSASTISFRKIQDNSGEINPNESWVYIVGSNSEITLASNPQISAGAQDDKVTLQCAGSSVTLFNGSGLTLMFGNFRMNSGDIINLFYSATDSLWHETSRS